MRTIIESTLTSLLQEFATSMASDGKPRRDRMIIKLEALVDEAQATERRCAILKIKNMGKNR